MYQSEEAAVPFKAALESCGRVPVVKVYGEVDLGTVGQLRFLLSEALKKLDGLRYMVVDLSQVTFMDSTGIGVFTGRPGELPDLRDTVRLVLREGAAARTFEVTGLDRRFRIYPDVRSAAGYGENSSGANGNSGS